MRFVVWRNKPGTAQVGAISKAQKQQKDFKVSKYSLLRYRKNPKVEPNWRTRGDTLRFFIHSVANQKKLKEGTFGEKKFFEKKSHNAEKTERGDPLLKFFFEKKVSQRRQYSKAVPFGPFEFLR